MALLDLLIVFLIVGGCVAGTTYGFKRLSVSRSIRHVPAPALGSGDVPIAHRLTTYYRLCQRAVRVLDRLEHDYSVGPMLGADDKREMREIVNAFYDEEGVKG